MPSIIVDEKDYTQGTLYNSVNVTVYLPILLNENVDAIEPTLYSRSNKLEFIENILDNSSDSSNNSKLAEMIIDLGGKVLVEGIENESVLETDEFWTKLEDKSLYQFRFITVGDFGYNGFGSEGDSSVFYENPIFVQMSKVANARKDCVALLDCGDGVETITDIPSLSPELTIANKYCAGFAPWCTFENDVVLPGSSAYLLAFINSLSNNNPTYFAVSGVQRGVIPYLVRPNVMFGDKDVAIAQTRNQGAVTYNLIIKDVNYGYMVFGNRTMQPVGYAETQSDDLVASNFLNIRNLCIDIAKQCYTVSKKLQFEQLTSILWLNFTAGLSPMLDKMLNGQGITNYKITRVATNKKAELKAKIRISPIEAVEDFDLTIELTDTTSVVED